MPNMVGAIGGDDACGRRRLPRAGQWLFFQDSSHRRYPQMQSCPAQCLGDLDLAHAGAYGFQTLHDVADDVREPIHRLAELQKCLGAFDLTQSCQPLGRWIRGGCGLVSIVTSENESL